MKTLKLKESDFTFVGIAVTVILYVMNVIGTGVIVGGDIGHIRTEIPFYGFVAPILFIAFAAFVGYYTKRNAMKKAFIALYVTLLLPFVAEAVLIPVASGPVSTPLIVIPMFLAMPLNSLATYLFDAIEELAYALHINSDFLAGAIIPASLLLPLATAPIVYRFIPEKGDE